MSGLLPPLGIERLVWLAMLPSVAAQLGQALALLASLGWITLAIEEIFQHSPSREGVD